jgi:epidermal growth factor receptor substrate 15
LDELKQEIETLKKQQKVEKDKDTKVQIIKKIENKEKQIELLKKQINDIDKELKNKDAEENSLIILGNSAKLSVSEEEKSNLSKIENYDELKKLYEAEKSTKENRSLAYKELETAKSNYTKAVADLAKNPSAEHQQKVILALENLKTTSKIYKEASAKHEENLAAYKNKTSSINDLAKLEKLFIENVEFSFVSDNNLNNNSKTSNSANNSGFTPFEILEVPQITSIEERVVVGAEMPMGLVYRVQVGAFRKAVKSNLYTEFKPVTGEIIKNGITRYITGYFNGILSASEAKKAIRRLGYKDAFVVAYCDGKRISIAQARKLEASGQCVPSGLDEYSSPENLANKTTKNNVVENKTTNNDNNNTNNNKGIANNKTTNKEKNIVPNNKANNKVNTSYNSKAGAVKAIAVETKLGLFFTVQIGAYRTPATAKQLKYTENVVSKLLPDGMIRYSTGIFPSISACMDTKNKVISSGIKDAFITAYYKGERITLAEAEKLLQEKGETIIEKL